MAEFSKLVVTEKGNALIAKALANTATIKFTKVSSTPTAYEPSELEKLESLSDIFQTHLKPKVQRINNTSVEVKAAFNNTELTNGYYIKAFGLYADDPDEGEILYGVAVETSGNCYMPAYNGVTSSGIYLRIVTTVGNSQNVSLEINPAAVATLGDIEELRDELEVVDFDDSGEIEGIESFTEFMSSFVKETSIYKLLANLKAGLKFVLHAGQIVNNCVTDNAGLPLAAAQGKALQDQITQLYSEIPNIPKMAPVNVSKSFTSSTSFAYTGLFIKIPKGSYYILTFSISYSTNAPTAISISNSASHPSGGTYPQATGSGSAGLSITCSGYADQEITLYGWAAYNGAHAQSGSIRGFLSQIIP
ncbi:hypothetical protein AALA90_18610 [Lachnospiraceae bacterium 38-10]